MDHPAQNEAKLHLAIVGGGIGGLALAVALTRLKLTEAIQVDIYEAAARLTQVGAGITLWPRGWAILRELGLEDDLAQHISPGQELPTDRRERLAFAFRKSDRAGPSAVIADLAFPGGSLAFHRADVQQVFLRHIAPAVHVHLGRRVAGYHEAAAGGEGGVRIVFTDGGTAGCDLLIGADGINSAVRRDFLAGLYGLGAAEAARAARPLWTGTMIYRGLIESEALRRQDAAHPALTKPMVYGGKNKHVVSYPISAGKLINAIGFVTDPTKEGTLLDGPAVASSTTEIAASFFSGWSEEVGCIMNNMHNPMRWAIETVRPLEQYGAGCVALLGDSAHAMPVHLGNGAGQAIEDAYILAHLLSKSAAQGTPPDVRKIVRVYSAVRQPWANFVARASMDQGRNYEFATPDFAGLREGDVLPPEALARVAGRIAEGWRWTWESSIAPDLERALAMI